MNALRLTGARIAPKIARNANQTQRMMGSHAKVEYTGVDAVVRKVFPEDHQLAAAILGGYTVLILVAKVSMGGGSDEAPAAAPAAATSGDAIPSVESAEFESFIENEANLMKWVDYIAK